MEGISIFNPMSSKHHALEDFTKLKTGEKVATLAITFFVMITTFFLAAPVIFRLMVNHYKVMHPKQGNILPFIPPITSDDQKNNQINIKIDTSSNKQPNNQADTSSNNLIGPSLDDQKNNIKIDTSSNKQPNNQADTSSNNLIGPSLDDQKNNIKIDTSSNKQDNQVDTSSSNLQDNSKIIQVDQSRKNSYQVATRELISLTSIIRALENEHSKISINSFNHFNVQMPIKIQAKGFETVLNVTGTCIKALLKNEYVTRFAYIIKLKNDEQEDDPFRIAFISKEDKQDPSSIGQLMIEHMNNNGSLGGRSPLTINDVVQKGPSSLKNTIDLTQKSIDTLFKTSKSQSLFVHQPFPIKYVNPSLNEFLASTLPPELKEKIQLNFPSENTNSSLLQTRIVQSAKKSNQLALRELDSSTSMIKALENGQTSVVVKSFERFNVNMPIKVQQMEGFKIVNLTGTCYKSCLEGEGVTRFAYIIELNNDEQTNDPFRIAFISNEDQQDPLLIGQLMIEHMSNQAGDFLEGKAPFAIKGVQEEESSIFKNTIDLTQKSVDRLFQSSNNHISFVNHSFPIKQVEPDLTEFLESMLSTEQKERRAQLAEANRNEKEETKEALIDEKREIELENDLTISVINKGLEREELGLHASMCNMVPYISDLLTNYDQAKIYDNDLIALRDGKIVKANGPEEAKRSYKEFRLIFKETYGTVLGRLAFGRYLLHKKDTLTFLDLKKAMVGIAMNVRENDLVRLFKYIQKGTPGDLPSYRVGNDLFNMNPELYTQIQHKENFDKLTPEEVHFLHSAFRTVALANTNMSITNVLDKLKIDSSKDYIYWHDIEGLCEMEYWRHLDLNHPTLAIGEYTGKALGYLELKKGMIIPMPEVIKGETSPNEPPHFYKVVSSLPDKNDAVIAHILAPMNSVQAPIDTKCEYAFLLFRGTNIDSGAKAAGQSLYRDFHWRGIGRATYDNRELDIQQMVENYLVSVKKDEVTLHLSGHSLGGCDTMRALVSILEKVANAEDGSPWKKLTNIVLTSFNAPKPNPTVNKRLKAVIKKIHEKGIKINIDQKHVRFFDNWHEDWLQKQGDVLLGVDYDGTAGEPLKEAAAFYKRKLITIKMDDQHGRAEGFLIRHQYRPFNKKHCNVPYKMDILSSDVESQRLEMEEKMACNFHYNPQGLGAKVRNDIYWYATTPVRNIGRALNAVVNVGHASLVEFTRLIYTTCYGEYEEQRQVYELASNE